jgi:hypothetical protein
VDSPFVEEGFFAISPDSSRVVYLADQDTDEVIELYTSRQVFPDLTLTKGNSTNGSVSVNTPFTWTLTFSNTGLATADFSDGQTLLTDALPDSGASYGLPLVQNAVNVTGTVDCALSGNDLNCAAAGAVSLAATTGQFQIAVRVTPTIVITLQNPRSGGVCQVDPNGVVAESNESNNTCNADTIVVNKADTIITIDSDSPDPSLVGQPYTVTVTVTSAGGTPEGTVAVNDGAGNTCTITLIGGTGSCLLTSTNVGSKNVTATYNGSTIFNGSSDIESHLVTDKSGLIRQYLPLVLKTQFQPPDLVVNSVLASSNAVTVVIQNQGQDPVNDAFWVEVYVNPTMPPTGPNQEWHKVGSEVGLVWGIVDLPISAGQSITLTLSSPSFAPNQSSPLPVVITPGSQVYAQVDSANTGVATGAVLETDETNNIVGPVISTVQRGPEPVVSNIEIFIEGLPPRE